ncbi:hypothetical protein [Bacteroides salyersiae]|uniref:hypothetical protein n=1 Tax=Bacteroides salyersiae TaxID=291644 RepID=UPI003F63FE55
MKFHYSPQTYSLGWENHGIRCYVPKFSDEYTIPLYQFELDGAKQFHYSTQVYSLGWENQGVMCYIYPKMVYDESISLY